MDYVTFNVVRVRGRRRVLRGRESAKRRANSRVLMFKWGDGLMGIIGGD